MTEHHHHDHSAHQHHTHQHASKAKNVFALPFFLILIFAIFEFAGGIWTNSLALLGDAWHMFSDVFALGLAWFASHHAANSKKHKNGQSYIEIIASMINVALMLLVVAYIIVEAIDRFYHPHQVTGGYVMLIAFVGLIVNIVVAKLLHDDHHEHAHNHNKRAAFLHVMSDLLGSLAALIAGAVIYFTGWLPIDAILSILISLLILIVTLKLISDMIKGLRS